MFRRTIYFILFQWSQRFHFYFVLLSLLNACWISYWQPYGLLFNLKHVIWEDESVEFVRESIIAEHKEQQKLAVEWMEDVITNPSKYPHLISNVSHQLLVYDYIHSNSAVAKPFSAYTLLNRPRQTLLNITDHIVISILYGKQDTDHREGKFYIGQILYHLLRYHHPRFLITLCENNNTNEDISHGINVIRNLFPVFIVNSVPKPSAPDVNTYEREKQAHLQCILANFQSFPNLNHLLLLQDDAEPISKDFTYQLTRLIDDRVQQQWPSNSRQKQQPAFIKIYHPRWLISYLNPSIYLIIQLLTTSFLLTFIGYYSYKILIKRRTPLKSTEHQLCLRLAFRNIIFLPRMVTRTRICCLAYFFLIIIILILIDHTNFAWSWRSLHPSLYAIYPAPSCCLPGVLYFGQTYTQVVDYLNQVECHRKYAIDTAFDDLPRRTNLRTYLVEPNLVHHIGLYSRLRRSYINPFLLD
ncbi:unnamed protein product [Adineta ricciae]|uniref:Uncharacterized protein n=1 Tax=Adineta ricciae TaxID=249248 RepID=A0A814JTA6_ADIRI|nr:unnamed protein product [Adineta ricciae]